MSALLRALMAQQVGGDDKPNLAVVTDASTEFSSDKKVPVTANLKKNTNYNVSFIATVHVTRIGTDRLRIGQYICWGNTGIVEFPSMNPGDTQTVYFDGVLRCHSDRNASRIDAILAVLYARGYEGTATINNLVITEV